MTDTQTMTIHTKSSGRLELRDASGKVLQRYGIDDLEKAEAAAWILDRNAYGGPHTVVDTQRSQG